MQFLNEDASLHSLVNCSFNFVSKIWNVIRVHGLKACWERIAWHLGHIPRNSMVDWMVTIDRLPTKNMLLSFGMNVDGSCLLCKQNLESRDNIIFHCDFSKEVWSNILSLCKVSRVMQAWDYEFLWICVVFKGKFLLVTMMKITCVLMFTRYGKKGTKEFAELLGVVNLTFLIL
ncbi:hypothetical protein GQ457_03G009100 [Hibiscus cannabinus]